MAKLWKFLTIALLSFQLQAETVFVSEQLSAYIRAGKGGGFGIVTPVTSGSRLELLETDSASGYSKVVSERGSEGWILTRHLSDKPAARLRLKDVEGQLATEREAHQLLKEVNKKYEGELKYLKQVSGNTIAINQRNQQLTEENQNLKNQLDLYTAENERLKDETKQDFFLYGAGTIILGLIIGLVAPSFKPRRKDTGWI